MCWQTLYSEKHLPFLHVYGVERTHESAIELVKNNLFFFNIFIDMLHNKIQVLNTSVQDNFIPTTGKEWFKLQ